MVDLGENRHGPGTATWRGTARPADGVRDGRLRRLVDVLVAVAGLTLLCPLLVLLALLVRVDSPGPALFRQVRVGRGGQPFLILKFRSMVADVPARGSQVSGCQDARATRVGRVLRAWRLDELPQLVNVLRGQMTVFGPRAEVPRYVAHYTPAEQVLLQVRPGLLGAGQLLFAQAQARNLDRAEDPERHYLEYHLHPKLALDLAYLRERGVRADCRLLGATVRYFLGGG